MSDMVDIIRAIVRDEMARRRSPELGLVTAVQPRDADGSDNNHQVNVRLRASGVELQRVPVAASRLGLSLLPKVDDQVLVVFANDDINAPVVVGSVYDETVQPPVGKAEEVVYMPTDADDSAIRRLHVELANGCALTLFDDHLTVKLGSTELTLNQDGDVQLDSAGKVAIKGSADITIEASGNLELKAQGSVKVSAGASLELQGSASAKLAGPSVTLAGNTQFSPG
jgi:phage baseplate assembly protein gpV